MTRVLYFQKTELPFRARVSEPLIPTDILGMILFLFAEMMFFAGLISAFLVLRESSVLWPPLDQPRLPLAVTGVNTCLLLLSGGSMAWSLQALRSGHSARAHRYLVATLILGCVFLGIQGFEWVRLLSFGLTTSSSVYGGTFYLLVGIHALHVATAVVCLFIAGHRLRRQQYSVSSHAGFTAIAMYWFFVVGLWPILFGLVYF